MKKMDDLIFHIQLFWYVCLFVGLACTTQASATVSTSSRPFGMEARGGSNTGQSVTVSNIRRTAVSMNNTARGEF